MKKITIFLLTVLFLLSLSSCYLFYSDSTPPYLDFKDSTVKIEISDKSGVSRTLTDSAEIEEILSVLKKAEPTRRESVNDTPAKDEYWVIRVIFAESTDTLYLYKSNRFFGIVSSWYVERPYSGIYEIREQDAKSILD